MKYTLELDIDVPRKNMIEYFDNPDNMAKWQPGFVKMEHVSGEPGEIGAKSKLYYKMGKREVEMIETITARNLPEEFCGTYEAKGVWNSVDNRFVEVGTHKTRWLFETEFKCSGFLRVMAFFMPGMFKKQSLENMKSFKEFAEAQYLNDQKLA